MPRIIQASFSRGEVSPSLYGRVDTKMYPTALRTARNTIIHTSGGISNRPGLQYVGPVKDHTKQVRLVEFQFKSTDTHILEFGDQYIRVLRDDAHVTEDSVNISGATQADPVVITTSVAHGYSDGDEILIENVSGMTELNNNRYVIANKTATTFELTDQVTGVNIDGSGFTAYTSGGTTSRIFTLTTPYLEADLFELKFVQSADVLTIAHPDYAVRELNRNALNDWTLTQPTFAPEQGFPEGGAVTVNTAGSVTHKYQVTAVSASGEESLPFLNNTTKTITDISNANPAVVTAASHGFSDGDEVHISGVSGMTEVNGRRFFVANSDTNTFELEDEDSTDYAAYTSGGEAAQTFVSAANSVAVGATMSNDVSWTAVDGAVKYSVYRDSEARGYYGWIGDTMAPNVSFLDAQNTAQDNSKTPPILNNPFRVANDYPGAVGYFQQRRVFGGSNNSPDTSEYSRIGQFNNFTNSDAGSDSDAISATLTSDQVNQIRHYVSLKDLLIFTDGSEWQVSSGGDASFTPTTITQSRQSRWGSSQRPPIVSGTTVIFMEDIENAVRSFGYSFQLDAYTGSHLSLLSKHLLEGYTISDWTYQRQPDSIIYMVRSDGKALTLSFDQEQEVVGWCRWDTLGDFESVAALRPSISSNEEAAYFIVKRKVNGNTVRYIERTHSRFFTDVRDAFFIDSGLSLDNPKTITAVTAADPVVVTCPSHGFDDGDEVDLFDIVWESNFDSVDNETQPDQLNTKRYTVNNSTLNTFELQDSDGNDIDGSAFNAYISGGTAREAVATVSGLDHLEGRTVQVLADGNVISDQTVSSGSLSLSPKASRVHVGLKYISDIETLDITADREILEGRFKKIPRVIIRFEKTRGLFVGHDVDTLKEMKWRESELMANPTALKTGDEDKILDPRWNSHGRLFLRQKYPLPLTVLAIVPDIIIGDDRV